MQLISENDWKQLSDALRRLEEISLTRTLGDTEITAETSTANKAWHVAMLVGVTLSRNGRVEQRQWFESVESAKREIGRWRIWGSQTHKSF